MFTDLVSFSFGLVPLEYAMQMTSAHCKIRSALSTSVKTQKMLLWERLLEDFDKSPTCHISRLCGVHLSDSQILIIIHGAKKLRSLDLSDSRGFTWTFLV